LLVPESRARNRVLFRLAIIVAVAAALYLFSRYKFSNTELETRASRKPAPELSLQDLNGQRLSLSQYKGKVVLLNFWATWCDPCRREIPRFVDLQKKYGNQGFQIVGVSLDDDAKAVPPFYQQYKMNYPVAVGNEKVAESFGNILGLPVNLLIDRDGRIAARHLGEADISQLENEIKYLLRTSARPDIR
jgi:cytochrome c biogenesis protein CcmG/thiol:disulfide interchange protein DsbE